MRAKLLNRVQTLERVSPTLPVKRTFHITLVSPDGEKQECILTENGLVEVSRPNEAESEEATMMRQLASRPTKLEASMRVEEGHPKCCVF